MTYNFEGKTIGIGITGSYCTYKKLFECFKDIEKTKADIYTIFSDKASTTDSRFGNCKDFLNEAKEISNKVPITSIVQAEPIGPKSLLDVLIIAPCTGNTLSKLANGISDSPVLMAAKAHLRNNKPLVIFLSTNDALGMNLKNIGVLLNTKNIYFVPFGQDDYINKPNSMVSHFELILDTINMALSGKQIQPVVKAPRPIN